MVEWHPYNPDDHRVTSLCIIRMTVEWHPYNRDDGTELKVSLSEKRKKWYSKLFSKDDDNINYLATKVSVEVDGTGSVRARISTNRLHSVIRRDQLTDLQLSNLIPTSDATRKRSKVEGHVSLDVTYAGMTIRQENVRVVSESDYPADELILGMNWINKSRVLIQSKGSKIIVLPPQIQNQKWWRWDNKLIATEFYKNPTKLNEGMNNKFEYWTWIDTIEHHYWTKNFFLVCINNYVKLGLKINSNMNKM